MEIEFLVGDLTAQEVEAIVNPANSELEMGGGVAAAIKKGAGKKIEEEAMAKAPVKIGKATFTSAGKLSCDYVIHAPTMEVPVQRTSVERIQKAVKGALKVARDLEIESLAMPGMGTGTGRVPVEEAAAAMIETIRKHSNFTRSMSRLVLVDQSEEMVAAWRTKWAEAEAPTPAPEEA